MRAAWSSIRLRLDRVGIVLSGLCALHCLIGIVLVTVFGLGGLAGEALFAPAIHRIGLLLAILVAVFTLGLSALRHGQRQLLALGAAGITLMAAGLFAPHGLFEALLTIAGVALVAVAHVRNLRLLA